MSPCVPSVWHLRRALLAMLMLASTTLGAHELRPSVADIIVTDDSVGVELRVNLEALMTGIGPEHSDTDDAPQAGEYDRLRELEPAALRAELDGFLPALLEGIELDGSSAAEDARAVRERDGDAGVPAVVLRLRETDIPEVGDPRVARDTRLRLTGERPALVETLRWRWPAAFGPIIVRAGEADAPDAFAQYLEGGERSDPFALAETAPRGTLAAVGDYLRVGFVHIVPLGLDHILFVVGLFLLSPYLAPMLWQITAFTLAHSVTLALGTLGLLGVPGGVVEPLIALSITAVCLENLFTTTLHRWRTLLVFGFGLLHGLGFASVLEGVGFAPGAFVTALVAFNLGVELGQLAVVLGCFALLGPFRGRPWYRRAITLPASFAIGGIGFWWFVQRLAG